MQDMDKASFFRLRLYVTATVTIAIWSLLAWNYYHGGIPAHHLLADKDLPSFSNGWGAIILPLLTWWLLYRLQRRVFLLKDNQAEAIRAAIYAFVISLAYGIVLSACYFLGYPDVAAYMTLGIFALALFFPVYRAEYFLGYVLGLTVSFGAVIPTMIGSILLFISFLLYRLIRLAVLYLVPRSRTK